METTQVATGAANTNPGEIGREEQILREEYLDHAQQEHQRFLDLTTPPKDVLDAESIKKIEG